MRLILIIQTDNYSLCIQLNFVSLISNYFKILIEAKDRDQTNNIYFMIKYFNFEYPRLVFN
jgi:hypothetical protein